MYKVHVRMPLKQMLPSCMLQRTSEPMQGIWMSNINLGGRKGNYTL